MTHYGEGTVDWTEEAKLKELFVGKSVKKVADDQLELSDGQKVKLVGNADCCAYYDLVELNEVENIITNVEVYADPQGDAPDWNDDGMPNEGIYKLFVYVGDDKINLATFEGTDSNGYYGTGFWLEVGAE